MTVGSSQHHITKQLSQAIREMRDFLLNNPSNGVRMNYNYKDNKFFKTDDRVRYKILYNDINKLIVKANTEGYHSYKHKNPHRTLSDFLKQGDVSILVLKYYSIPYTGKIKRFIEWVFDKIISKIKLPDIKIGTN